MGVKQPRENKLDEEGLRPTTTTTTNTMEPKQQQQRLPIRCAPEEEEEIPAEDIGERRQRAQTRRDETSRVESRGLVDGSRCKCSSCSLSSVAPLSKQ